MNRSAPQLNRAEKHSAFSRLQRLAEMGPHEIAYRLYKELAFRFDKWRTHRGISEISDPDLLRTFNIDWVGAHPEISLQRLRHYWRENVARRFYFNPAQRREYVSFTQRHYPQWIEQVRQRADKICQHRFQLLGLDEINFGPEINWHLDPETNREWPQTHWLDIPLSGDKAAGDPKVIWELNRHQQLLWLGMAYCYTEDESYVNEFVYQIERWIEQNPYPLGVNWASSLEIGFRAINWLWAIHFFINSPRLHNDTFLRIVKSLVQHFEAILHNPSIYSSPNTHLIGEACALYLGGVLLAEHEQAARWRKFADKVLAAEIIKQIGQDGSHKEQSAYYHCYTVEFYLLSTILGQRNRLQIEKAGWDNLERACEFLMHICSPSGELPAFGDEDGGRLLMFDAPTYRHPADILSVAAIVFNRPDFRYCARDFSPLALWLLGPAAFDKFQSLTPVIPEAYNIELTDSGQIVLRGDWSANASYLLFHATKKTFLPGHTHADSLSFELAVNGKMRLIDTGTYRYNVDKAARSHYRGTSAHNTVRIDDIDQSISADAFKWQRQADSEIVETVFTALIDYVAAEHNGYQALAEPCGHRRAIMFVRPDYFVIFDEFSGTGEHSYQSFLHFGDAQLSQTEAGWLNVNYPDNQQLLVVPLAVSALSIDTFYGDPNSLLGWRSSAYGSKEPSLTLRFGFHSPAPARMVTLLIPYIEQQPTVKSLPSTGDGLCLEIKRDDCQDIIASSNARELLRIDEVSFQAKCLWLRSSAGKTSSIFAAGATRIALNQQILLNNANPLPQFNWTAVW